jgi:hypothetical protein
MYSLIAILDGSNRLSSDECPYVWNSLEVFCSSLDERDVDADFVMMTSVAFAVLSREGRGRL